MRLEFSVSKEIPTWLASHAAASNHLTSEQKSKIVHNGVFNRKTVRHVMKDMLVNKGMFEEQADAVLERAEQEMETMKGNWSKEADGYPKMVITLTQSHINIIALDWIIKNTPDAWFRAVFESDPVNQL